MTLNGKGFVFDADEMTELDGVYTFYYDGEIVGEFKKDAIAGYFIMRVEGCEDDEMDE